MHMTEARQCRARARAAHLLRRKLREDQRLDQLPEGVLVLVEPLHDLLDVDGRRLRLHAVIRRLLGRLVRRPRGPGSLLLALRLLLRRRSAKPRAGPGGHRRPRRLRAATARAQVQRGARPASLGLEAAVERERGDDECGGRGR